MKLPTTFTGFYVFGSTLYGTNTSTSDTDVALVNHKTLEYDLSDVANEYKVLDIEEFETQLNKHEPTAMEGYSLQFHGDVYTDKHWFSHTILMDIDLGQLRESYSSVSSNSFVKAKKKLLVQASYDKNCSKKSLFHSIRILDFGAQIAKHGYIVDFKSCDLVWKEINDDYTKPDTEIIELIKTKYTPLRNLYASAFKLVAPKK